MFKLKTKTPEKYRKLKSQVLKYAREEFNHDQVVEQWHASMLKAMGDFKKKKQLPSWNTFVF